MPKSVLIDLNLNRNELQNAVIQNLSTAPSNPIEGLMYYNTNDNIAYIYDGTVWRNTMSTGDYTFVNGIEELSGQDAGKVQLKLATGANAGNVVFTANNNGLAGTVNDASTSSKGVIEIATDAEAEAGSSEVLAVNPKQLANAVDDKIELTDLSIASGSVDYLGYDNSTGQFSAKVDTTVTDSSTKLVTSGAVATAIANAIVGGVIYKGTWDITSATDFSGITLPVKKGYLYYVTGTGPKTIGGIEWSAGDYLLVNDDVAEGGSLSGKVEKVDNTEAADIVRLDAVQTLTNKTIDADDNTISNLEVDNFKSGVVVASSTGISPVSSASDTKLATEKAIASALTNKASKLVVNNTALTPSSDGVVTWTISNTLASADLVVTVKEVSTGDEVGVDIRVSSSNIVIKFNATSTVAADTYTVVAIGY
jgi:hypothetical protein